MIDPVLDGFGKRKWFGTWGLCPDFHAEESKMYNYPCDAHHHGCKTAFGEKLHRVRLRCGQI